MEYAQEKAITGSGHVKSDDLYRFQKFLSKVGVELAYSIKLDSLIMLKVMPNDSVFVMDIHNSSITNNSVGVWDLWKSFLDGSQISPKITAFQTHGRLKYPTPDGNLEKYQGYDEWDAVDLSQIPAIYASRHIAACVELGINQSIILTQLTGSMTDDIRMLVWGLLSKTPGHLQMVEGSSVKSILGIRPETLSNSIRPNGYNFALSNHLKSGLIKDTKKAAVTH